MTLSCVRVTIVVIEKQKVLHIMSECVCILSYPAYRTHAPRYVVICGLSGCIISFHTSQKRYDLNKKLLNFIFFTTFVRNVANSENNSARYYKCA